MKKIIKIFSLLLAFLMVPLSLVSYAESVYILSETKLSVGEKNYDVNSDYEYTVFVFSPDETGKYTISSDNAKLGIISYNGMWATVSPSVNTVNSGVLEWNCTSVGQRIWVAVDVNADSATILVELGEMASTGVVRIEYVNEVTPHAFTLDNEIKSGLVRVETFDNVADSAVLGIDGNYHFNDQNGPVLYANLSDSVMSLYGAYGYGQLKCVVYENGVAVSSIDYNKAFEEYYNAISGSSKYYPLTVDLIEMFKNIGEGKEWYGSDGFVGGEIDDAWMFACYYVNCKADEHSYGEWKTVVAPTVESEGLKSRSCSMCGLLETEAVPTVDNFYGDVNGDGTVNTKDVILLRKYVSSKDPLTDESDVEIFDGADVNVDGSVNTKDIILIRQYIAAKDPITGESSVVLGPAA